MTCLLGKFNVAMEEDAHLVASFSGELAAMTEQVAQNGLLNIEKIDGARCKMATINAFERLGMAAHDLADGVFGGKALFFNGAFDFLSQARVFDEMHVGGKDGPILPAQ